MALEPKTQKFVDDFKEWHSDLETEAKFVFWWLSFLAVAVVFAIIFFSIVWTPWVAGVALIFVAVIITIACFMYIEENY